MRVFLLLLLTLTSGQAEVTSQIEVTTEHQQPTTQQDELVSGEVKLTTLKVQGLVRLRYATFEVHGEMENQGDMPGEATFVVHLPDTAFVSKAVLEVDGRLMDGEVREKKKAEQEYQQAVQDGFSAGHVTSVRDSSHVRVSVNVAPRAKASFNLTYEELLVRRKGRYELAINLTPGQVADYTSVDIKIQEASNITFVRVPPFDSALTPNGNDDERANPDVKVTWPSDEGENIAKVQYESRGTKFALPGPLIVRYDVDHSAQAGEVLLMDGYFVHFLAARPEREAEPLPKHAVFVLDSSGSMWGRKLRQLKDAMKHILGQLRRQDVFSIVTFSTSAAEWSIQGLEPAAGRGVYSATKRNIALAQEFINRMEASGATNIQSALRRALVLAARYRNVTLSPGVSEGSNYTTSKPTPVTSERQLAQPVVMFLTDGMPTAGELRLNRILSVIKFSNQAAKASIFALAFGDGANLQFLRKLSLQNSGFSRRIYEAADSAKQLQSFYQEVSSPLLTNLTFAYVDTKVSLSSVTMRHFPTLFSGSELVVAGRLLESKENGWNEIPSPTFPIMGFVSAQAVSNVLEDVYMPSAFQERAKYEEGVKKRKPGHLERAWAYLTVRQLLDAAALEYIPYEAAQNQTLTPTSNTTPGPRERALEIALKYGFVTPVTSLVMVDRSANNTSSEGNLLEAVIKVDTVSETQSVDLEGMNVQDKVIPTPLRPMPGRPMPMPAAIIPHVVSQPQNSTSQDPKNWLDSMPWLIPLLQPGDELILPQENDNITRVILRNPSFSEDEEKLCQLPGTNEEGSCQHLALCSSSHADFTDLQTLLKSFCDIEGKYVGVCCASA